MQQFSGALGVAIIGTLFFQWLPDDGWYDATRAILLVSIGLYAVSFLAVFLLPKKAREDRSATSKGADELTRYRVVGDVAELPPDQQHEDRGADEGEPERRRDAPVLGEHSPDAGADDQPAEDADQVDAADPALELRRHRPLPDRDRRSCPR